MTQKTKLRDIVPYRATVTLTTGHVLEIRPINLMDIMALVTEFGPQVSISFAKLTQMAKAKTLKEADVRQALSMLIDEAPNLMIGILALASDDNTEEGRLAAASLPLPDQLAMFDTIFKETMHSEAEVKKLTASLVGTLAGIFGATKVPKTGLPLMSSTGPFGGK